MKDMTELVSLRKAIGELDDALVALDNAKRYILRVESNLRGARKDPRGEKVIKAIQPVRWWRDELVEEYDLLRRGTASE